MENDVDRVLVYVTLYIVECLKKLQKSATLDKAQQESNKGYEMVQSNNR